MFTSMLNQVFPDAFDQIAGVLEILAQEREANRFPGVSVFREPAACSPIGVPNSLGMLCEKPSLQKVSKEVMISVPLALAIEGYQKEVLRFDSLEQPLAVLATRDLSAEIRAQALEERGREKEIPYFLSQSIQNRFAEIIGNRPVAARKLFKEEAAILGVLERQGDEAEPCDPTLRPLHDRRHVFPLETVSLEVVEEELGFFYAKAQVSHFELEQRSRKLQGVDRKGRHGSTGNDEGHGRR
jgi:hypothetical protein